MFEYIKLKNFKSFGNITFDLLDRFNTPKNMALVFGENGIGKSNLASSFFFLMETMRTMDARDLLQSILSEAPEKMDKESLTEFLRKRYKDLETLVAESKMVDSDDNMYLEFGFRINGRKGKYIIETNNTEIIHERLEFTITKNRGTYFDITSTNIKISGKIFLTSKALEEIKIATKKFWGKHTLLAIILHESQDKADSYIKHQISENFKKVLAFLTMISCRINVGSSMERGIIGLPSDMVPNFDEGEIVLKGEDNLNRLESMLNIFFHSISKDIKKAYYKKSYKKKSIEYKLMIVKHIAGKDRNIDFSLESTGTQFLIQLLPFMLMVSAGSIVVIDEFDSGLHDLLVQNLVISLMNSITDGQLIMTTHNTNLMEADIRKDFMYVITEKDDSNKEIECITHYDNQIHQNTNIRNQYLTGRYQGIPSKLLPIDFHQLFQIVKPKEG